MGVEPAQRAEHHPLETGSDDVVTQAVFGEEAGQFADLASLREALVEQVGELALATTR